MLFAFLPLLALVFGAVNLEGVAAPLPRAWVIVLLLVGLAALAWLEDRLGRCALDPEQVMRWQQRTQWGIAGWILLLWWGANPVRLALGRPPEAHLWQSAVLFPALLLFLLGLVATNRPFYQAMGEWRSPRQRPIDFLRARLAAPMLFIPPIMVWIVLEDTLFGPGVIGLGEVAGSPLRLMLVPVFFVGLYLAAPALFNLAWRARPLPEGPLLDRLRELSRRAGVPVSGVRIWDTFEEPVANAAVAGLSARYRFVYLTNHLLETFDDDGIVAIVAHELAHLRLGHVALYLLFSLDLAFLSLGLSFWLYYHHPQWLLAWPSVVEYLDAALFLAGFFVIFTALARRCELQADQFAAGLVGSAEVGTTLARVAARVGELGAPVDWRQRFATHPAFEERFAAIAAPRPPAALQLESRQLLAGLVTVALVILLLASPTLGLAREMAATRADLAASRLGAAERRLTALQQRIGWHPEILRLGGELAVGYGRWFTAAVFAADAAFELGWVGRLRLQIPQQPAAPEVALQLDLVEFLLQVLHFR